MIDFDPFFSEALQEKIPTVKSVDYSMPPTYQRFIGIQNSKFFIQN